MRGRVVRLGPAIDTILDRHDYPDAVSRAASARRRRSTALLGSSLKFDGRFQLQTQDRRRRSTCWSSTSTRPTGCAPTRASTRSGSRRSAAGAATTGELLGHGHLAMTIDQGAQTSRYQGVVALEGQGLEEAAHQYFRQSEQIPTRVRLAVAEESRAAAAAAWRAGGLMVQFLPTRRSGMRQADLPPGDAPEGHAERRRRRRGRRLGRGAGARRHGRGSRAGRPGGVERAPALPPVPRARRAGLRAAADRARPAAARASASWR